MTHDNVTDIERRYLLQKRGLYYRPDRCGYTGIKEHAGRYFEHEASLPDVVAIHEDEAAEFSPSCYDDLARQHLQEQNASLRKQLEDAREALRHIKVEAEREQGHWQHLKRVIAVHADEALNGKS